MTTKNPLQRLADFGQSVWCDNLSRGMIVSGELQRLIDEDGIVGITSNPTIFDTAISKSNDYDDQIWELVAAGRAPGEVLQALMITDIQNACDILRPVFDATGGLDGVVSLEVSPVVAHDTEATISEARLLFQKVNRPNVMIKIPGTDAGVPAIEQALYEGINVNITLLFSLDAYRQVMAAYLSAMERRVREGKPVHDIVSVASFFVSRVDSEVDMRLQAVIDKDTQSDLAGAARALLGQVAIANARLAYQEFRKIFNSERFGQLAGHGVRIQRPLWASTSTKNPDYLDTLYIDELIGPNTVQTLAPASIEAFRDHGNLSLTVEKDVDLADDAIATMEALGIAYDDVIDTVVREGVEKFSESFESLEESIQQECARIGDEIRAERRAEANGLADSMEQHIAALDEAGAASALRESNGSFWSSDSAVAREIDGLLGWLHVVPQMLELAELGLFKQLAEDIQRRGYDRVLLFGMGGSSLAPEVMASTLRARRGFPTLEVLDTTHPETIQRAAERLENERTLFIVSSKSGTTIETTTLFDYFLSKHHDNSDDFIVITDPGTPLEARARAIGVWKVFVSRHDIGGRFSALSYFGLVPATAAGLDVRALLANAATVLPVHDVHHPGIALGAALAAAQESGRDKLTLLASDHWRPFGDWLEQLIAESTGKHGIGIVPVVREPLRSVNSYGQDRVFAVIDDGDATVASLAGELREAGHPVLAMPGELGHLFLTWEIATAVVGQRLGINPFDQPNVQEAKDQTNAVIEGRATGNIEVLQPRDAIERVVSSTRPGDYVAIQAYVDATRDAVRALETLRTEIGAATGVVTMLGIGPRFLHSTGQLHKGGPKTGVFLQIFQKPSAGLDIPGRDLTFDKLITAQANGDYLTLQLRGLRVVRVNLSGDLEAGLRGLTSAVSAAGIAAD